MVVLPIALAGLVDLRISGTKGHDPKTVMQDCRMIDWDDMRVFLGVARARSLSGAAPGLRMDPATVGRRIARLEEALGAALFLKSQQGYALTDLGARLQARAEEAEEAL